MLTALRLQKIEDKAEARGEEKGKAEGIAEGEAKGKSEEQKGIISILEKNNVDEKIINEIKARSNNDK